MKRFILPTILIIILFIVYLNIDFLTNTFADILESKPKIVINPANNYAKNYKFNYVEPTNEFTPYSYQELINIIYTVLNNGWDNFTFYCPDEYKTCINDLKNISENEVLLTHINNYVHPYNSFKNIKTTYDNEGEVNLKITKLYSKEEIKKINQKVENIINENINSSMNDEEKIKIIHDYIINNTKYDSLKNDTGESEYKSNTAYGALIEHYAVCGGYSDAMEIFLNKFNIKNFKIASQTHVWNAVYLNNKWLHLDLTWDDPVASDGNDYLLHSFFLIDTTNLKKQDTTNHEFDTNVYSEIK